MGRNASWPRGEGRKLTEQASDKAKVAKDIEQRLQEKFSRGNPDTPAFADRQRPEAAVVHVRDGRVRSTVDERGTVQFNVRVTLEVKNAMLEIARSEGLSISEAAEASLRMFIELKRKGAA